MGLQNTLLPNYRHFTEDQASCEISNKPLLGVIILAYFGKGLVNLLAVKMRVASCKSRATSGTGH